MLSCSNNVHEVKIFIVLDENPEKFERMCWKVDSDKLPKDEFHSGILWIPEPTPFFIFQPFTFPDKNRKRNNF